MRTRNFKLCLLSLVLCLALCISVAPASVSAAALTVASGSPLTVDTANNYILGVSAGTTVDAIFTNFTEATASLSATDKNGAAISGSTKLSTGATVSVDGTKFTVVANGDVDGNSVINSSDTLLVKQHVKKQGELAGAYKQAADVNKNGNVDTLDYIKVKLFVAGFANHLYSKETPTLSKTEPSQKTLNYHSKTYKIGQLSGTHSGTLIVNDKLVLSDSVSSGYFITDTINVGAFRSMLTSWNAETNGGRVEISVSFEVTTGAWSDYISFGVWSSTSGVSTSKSKTYTHASVNVDTLNVNSSYTTTGNIKVKMALTKSGSTTPVLRNITVATPTMALYTTVDSSSYSASAMNYVTVRSQVASENGAIGSRICSPTTTAMGIEYMGTTVTTLTAANAMYDQEFAAYGNWLFATAYAGEHGYVAYCDFYDANMLKYALSQGYVIGCSTKLTQNGHLVLVVGYENGQYIVNDPNISSSSTSRKYYDEAYFNSCWFKSDFNNLGVVYVFQGDYTIE